MEQEQQEKDLPRVTEEAILDSLFYACDTKGTGFVAVSKLIEYLRSAIASDTDNNNIEFVDNLDDLSLILDPDGQDVHIDISTYQSGISEWIEDIRKRSIASFDDDFLSSVSVNYMSPSSPMLQPFSDERCHVTSTPNMSSNSVEGLGGESPLKNDSERTAEMTSIIETLQLNNKRLMEQHIIIQTQMEQTEESNSQLLNEVEDLKKQIQSLQSVSLKYKDLEAENLELRQSVADAKEISSNLQKSNTILSKEKNKLENSIEQLQSKLVSMQVQLDALQDERRALSESLAIQKQVNIRLEEIRDAKEDLVQESSSKSEYLSSVIHELSLANEDLKTEKSKLSEALSDLNGELSRLRKQNSPKNSSNLQNQNTARNRKHFSLRQELEEQLTSDSKELPSPLIGASFLNESLNNSISSNQSAFDSILSNDSTNSSFDGYSVIASQVANEFKDKKEKALQQIEELDKQEKTPEINQKQLQLKNQFDKDVELFAEKVNVLNLKKKNAEKRAAKLLVAMKKLKEESKQFQDERDKAYQKLGNLSLNTDHLDTRVSDLQNELASERMKSKDMEEKLKSMERQLVAVTGDLSKVRDDKESIEKSLNSHIETKESLEKLLDEVRRSHTELDVQQTHQILKIKELESELARVMSNLSVEKQRVTSLEESLQLSVNKNSSDMQEIIDMIPMTDAQLTTTNKSPPRSSSPRVTGHAVRSRLQEFLNNVGNIAALQDSVRIPPDRQPIIQTGAAMMENRPQPRSPTPPLSPTILDRSLRSPAKETKTTESQTDLTGSIGELSLTSLWRRKLSPGSDDDSALLNLDGIDLSINKSHFVEGVGLHVRPPPSEKEIEKQFRTLILAFQTDQLTLNKRLEIQKRSREIAERNIDRELQNLSTQLKNLEEKYMKSRDLQQAAASLKAQVEVLRRSSVRLGIVAQQHGSVQQESCMWSGIEVMICHAENLNRHLERVKLDLSEYRLKEQLQCEDSDIAGSRPQQTNGPIRLGSYGDELKTTEDQSNDNTNSLVNFVMAIHNTSQRAKQVIKNFRRPTLDASAFYSPRKAVDSREESVDEPSEEEETGARESDASGTSVSDEDDGVFIPSRLEDERIHGPSLCRRVCSTCFRFTLSVILIMALSITTIVFLNHNTSYKLQREHLPNALLELLDPIATLVHNRRPPS